MDNLTKILKKHIKPAALIGILAATSCIDARAETTQDYSFDKVGTRIELPLCGKSQTNEVTTIYSTDLNGDGKPEVIIGTKRCGVYIYENKVPQKQVGE